MKIPFKIEKLFNKVFKPQIVTIVETYIDDKLSQRFFGKSFTANFLQGLYNEFAGSNVNFAVPGAFPSNNTAGKNTLGNTPTGNYTFTCDAAIGILTNGIVVGSGNTAPTPLDFIMQTLITQGVGAGQLQYQPQTAPIGTTVTGAITSFTLERLMVNGSGGDVTVNEIGLYNLFVQTFLIYRDVLGSSDIIPNGHSYRVSIEFQITT